MIWRVEERERKRERKSCQCCVTLSGSHHCRGWLAGLYNDRGIEELDQGRHVLEKGLRNVDTLLLVQLLRCSLWWCGYGCREVRRRWQVQYALVTPPSTPEADAAKAGASQSTSSSLSKPIVLGSSAALGSGAGASAADRTAASAPPAATTAQRCDGGTRGLEDDGQPSSIASQAMRRMPLGRRTNITWGDAVPHGRAICIRLRDLASPRPTSHHVTRSHVTSCRNRVIPCIC